MPRISRPTDKPSGNITGNLSWETFVSDIIKGKYVLLVGSEVILKGEYGGGDSTQDILASIIEDLKAENLLGSGFSCSSFTELARKTGRSDAKIRTLINNALLGNAQLGIANNYNCDTDAVSKELKELLRTRFFRVVMTTTYDEYLENVMREIWGNELRIMSIYDEGRSFDLDEREQSSEEFDVRPTLYYICGKVNNKGKKFVATENDAIEVVARWFSKNAPLNFLNNIRPKGIISLGCKFDDWLFRFFWYILRKDVNTIDTSLKDAVAVSFTSESGKKLNEYLKSKNVYTEPDARSFITSILSHKDQCIKDIASANSRLGGVFISYAHEDMPIVSSIVERLKEEGFDVWFDSAKLESGDRYDARICQAIAKCKIFVPILSPQVKQDLCDGHLDRYYIKTEWALAKQRAHNIDSNTQRMYIMPLAISGYNEREEYHSKFLFADHTVTNLMNIPISRFVERVKINVEK
ncbi:MAG: toll/interleukin-1 receptor domain-containing protein [Prevotella sp.]|nr:toll/interleukin-1 receptor domain-containing protein [Prevotella sp.]